MVSGDTIAACSILNNWPDDLNASLSASFVVGGHRSLRSLNEASAPYVQDMRDGVTAAWEDVRQSMAIASYGVSHSHIFPVQDIKGGLGAIVFTGASGEMDPTRKQCMELTCSAIFNRLAFLPKAQTNQLKELSTRELECLIWAAEGKTSVEVAEILRLSEHTVNHHLASATLKLGAVNRTHAVVRAIRWGLITI